MHEIEGIILQPLSKSKYSWSNYKIEDDFLNFFQKIMREEIGNEFDVDYNTEEYSNYLLIPYSRNRKPYQCFGSYFVSEGIGTDRVDLRWGFIIDESKNKEFDKIIMQQDILDKAEILGEKFEQITNGEGKGNGFHYLLQRPSKKLIEFIINIDNEKELKNKQAFVIESNDIKKFKISLDSNYFDEKKHLKKEETKIKNGADSELLVYNSIKNQVNLKILGREVNKLFDDNQIIRIQSEIDKFIHYSKNFNAFAPFDLISTKEEELIFIEVKSTTENEIYFSINEILFAYEHINNYQVKIVKDEIIYDIDISNIILDIYKKIKNNDDNWSFETIKIKLKFNDLID